MIVASKELLELGKSWWSGRLNTSEYVKALENYPFGSSGITFAYAAYFRNRSLDGLNRDLREAGILKR